MANSTSPEKIDVSEIVKNIREQIGRRTEQEPELSRIPQGIQAGAQAAEALHTVTGELRALASRIRRGEPQPSSQSSRGRVGAWLKFRLYRLLWWHTHQIQALADWTARLAAEQEPLAALFLQAAQEVREARQLAWDCKRQAQNNESRLRDLESAQLKLQAAEIERSVRRNTADDAKLASLRSEQHQLKDALRAPEAELLALRQEHQGLKDSLRAPEAELLSLRQELENLKRIVTLAEPGGAEHSPAANGAASLLQEPAQSHIDELARRLDGEIAQRDQLAARLSELGLYTHQTRAALSVQDRRLALFIEEARKRLPGPFAEDQLRTMVDAYDEHKYDMLYAAFEDVFRGSREEIKMRQGVYLPLLKEHGVGGRGMPVIDLGCGRGEWLELLRENELEARGVDRDEMMIERCRAEGLNVERGDALSCLRALPDGSAGAVTSFHMVEHLPFDLTLAVVDECLRVLKPGGILILETPNPQNILVGSHTFYLDPTHLKPLPSPMLRFFVEARGFCDVQVRELHPYPASVRFPDDNRGVANRLNDYLYGPQDYAVIGRKP